MTIEPPFICPRCGGWAVSDGTYVACTEQTCTWFQFAHEPMRTEAADVSS